MMNNQRGILILSHGSERYAQFAFNLGASIRQHNPDLPICLLHDGNWNRINIPFKSPFTHYRHIEEADQIPFYIKTRLNHYSPFQETIYLDSDAICTGDLTGLFSTYQPHGFAVQKLNESTLDNIRTKTAWADIPSLYKFYDIPLEFHYTETNTSFIYWERGKADHIWTLWEHFYAQEPFGGYNAQAFGTYPDELALGAALLHIDHRLPRCMEVFFRSADKPSPKWAEEYEGKFRLFGLYGDAQGTHRNVWERYTRETQLGFLMAFQEYGFKLFPTDKWSSNTKASRFRPLRTGERPEEIAALINSRREAAGVQ